MESSALNVLSIIWRVIICCNSLCVRVRRNSLADALGHERVKANATPRNPRLAEAMEASDENKGGVFRRTECGLGLFGFPAIESIGLLCVFEL